ncbi:sensor histidine kinase [Brevibacillus sp. AY1]|uniref:ATP-binding protein n=1 Tax=Brevibacillus sp. AY1 TaxID=2807621 RepID=UPI0024579172|nr:sensor histidine kinase [Brevibacillus sp. AY1]MDH4616174.1 ATP-binding protein [Brevibacillus sp. AY1]
MSLIKEITLQLFFALIPFVMYNIYYRDKMRSYSSLFILITSSISLLLAMTFASSAVEGLIFDIRYVIMFFGLVYGGIQTGLILLVEFVIYRLYLGGDGKWVALLILVVSFSLSLVFAKKYRTSQNKTSIILVAGIVFSALPMLMTYLFLHSFFVQNIPYHAITIPLKNCIGIWLLMTLFSKAVEDKEMFIRHAQNEKITTMSHVAASLVHEVRNPLTAVKGFLKLIKEAPDDLPKVEQYITICLDEVKRTEAILSDYLSISKPLSERHERIDLSAQITTIHDVMFPFATMNNVELEVQAPQTPVLIMANPDEIKQVLVNFIKNAVEACSHSAQGKVTLLLKTEESQAILEIKDNGIGMSEKEMSRLGSIYFSTKSSGTGLGLTYSYNAIHVMGGKVAVNSIPRIGTTFTISFPMKFESP